MREQAQSYITSTVITLKFSRQGLISIAALTIIYFIAAQFGLSVSAVNKFSALVWPPSGLALAALLIFGRHLWPAIFLGAFLANVWTGAHVIVAIGIATGNTLEAIIAMSICQFGSHFRHTLERPQDVTRLIVAAVLSTLVSATIGVSSLWLGGTLNDAQIPMSWMQWWAGDVLGIVSITPLLLVFLTKSQLQKIGWNSPVVFEELAFVTTLIGVSLLVLSSSPILETILGIKTLYLLVPVLLWGAMRFDQRGATLATFVIAIVAVWNTAQGAGHFTQDLFAVNLLHLMVFAITMTLTGLFVGSIVSQRELERLQLIKNEIELSTAKEAAEAANLAKSAFLANMSHEIRTPLGAVMGFAELVAEDSSSSAEKISYIEAIKRNGELLSNLINDILDLSKIEAGKVEIHIREIAIGEILKDLETTFAAQAHAKGIKLHFVTDPNVPAFIYTDPLRLRQILNNIVGNAVKFTHQGTVSLRTEFRKTTKSTDLSFTIEDTGIGIRSTDSKKLFSPFSQVDISSKRKYGGTGLGLVLSKRLAVLLGGDIVLTRSEIGQGSTFTVTIDPGPVQDLSKIETKTNLAPANQKRLTKLHILLAEDSTDNQILVQQILNSAGAMVTIANNGKEAVEKARQTHYDVVIMDLQMPIMDGFEATKELRRHGYKGKIVALTAHALSSDRERCLASGFDEHFSKPINKNAFIECLGQL